MRKRRCYGDTKKFDSRDGIQNIFKPIKKIDNLYLLKKIGSGSFGKVYAGYNKDEDKFYAVKKFNYRDINRHAGGISILEREIRMLRQFDHENILKLYNIYKAEELPFLYLVLEFAECGSLKATQNGSKPIYSYSDILSIIKQAVRALTYMHSKGIVHQDIKPSNILLCRSGKVLIADFGIGHRFQSAAMVVGSPAYQAPEALDDDDSYFEEDEDDDEDADESSKNDDDHNKSDHKQEEEDFYAPTKEDVWALGVSFYQLLFNRLPYTGENFFEIVNAIKTTKLNIPETCDAETAALLRKMLCIEPHERISMTELAKEKLIASASDLVQNPVPINELPQFNPDTPVQEIKVRVVKQNELLSNLIPVVPHAYPMKPMKDGFSISVGKLGHSTPALNV